MIDDTIQVKNKYKKFVNQFYNFVESIGVYCRWRYCNRKGRKFFTTNFPQAYRTHSYFSSEIISRGSNLLLVALSIEVQFYPKFKYISVQIFAFLQ